MPNPFTAHPRSVGEGYLEHGWFALKVAGRLLGIAACAAVHAVFPFLFVTTTREKLFALVEELKAPRGRRAAPESRSESG